MCAVILNAKEHYVQDFSVFFKNQRRSISNADFLPAYKLLQLAISAGIKEGLWKSGELLPPERKLADACDMSVGTVKRAMLDLVHQGVLFRRQGSGTYVAGPSFHRQYRRYYLLLKNFGGVESDNSVFLHSIERISAVGSINKTLNLEDGEELYKIIRLFSEDEQKYVLAYSYLSARQFPGLNTLCRAKLENVPLFILLEEEYDTPTLKTDELFAAVCAENDEASLLNVSLGTPLLKITSLVYSNAGKPFEYRISYCLTEDRYICRSIG